MSNDPAFISEESLVPALFLTAGRADASPLARPGRTTRRALAEMTLNPRRLEAILEAAVKKKKSASR